MPNPLRRMLSTPANRCICRRKIGCGVTFAPATIALSMVTVMKSTQFQFLVAACSLLFLFGCSRPTPSIESLMAMAPLELLREAGRTICDARTAEIHETIEFVGPNAESQVKYAPNESRIQFGPDGEYRFETARGTLIHDGKTVATWPLGGQSKHRDPYREWTHDLSDIRYIFGPHLRRSGDMVMTAGMLSACDRWLPLMRLCGKGWVAQCGFCTVVKEELQACPNHKCRRILVLNNSGDKACFWVDTSRAVIHKATQQLKDGSASTVNYNAILLNTRIPKGQFDIPADVVKKALENEAGTR